MPSNAADVLGGYIGAISRHRSELEQLGITGAAIAGSIARGEAKDTSDVDVVVDFDPVVLSTTFALVRVKLLLDRWLDRDVDIISRRALQYSKHRAILEDAKVVF